MLQIETKIRGQPQRRRRCLQSLLVRSNGLQQIIAHVRNCKRNTAVTSRLNQSRIDQAFAIRPDFIRRQSHLFGNITVRNLAAFALRHRREILKLPLRHPAQSGNPLRARQSLGENRIQDSGGAARQGPVHARGGRPRRGGRRGIRAREKGGGPRTDALGGLHLENFPRSGRKGAGLSEKRLTARLRSAIMGHVEEETIRFSPCGIA